jgi:hypothetical protein
VSSLVSNVGFVPNESMVFKTGPLLIETLWKYLHMYVYICCHKHPYCEWNKIQCIIKSTTLNSIHWCKLCKVQQIPSEIMASQLNQNTIQYNTIQYNTIQYNTIQYNTIQYNTIQYNTIQYNTIQYNTIQKNTIQYNTINANQIKSNQITWIWIKLN